MRDKEQTTIKHTDKKEKKGYPLCKNQTLIAGIFFSLVRSVNSFFREGGSGNTQTSG
ncbi:hypothetical protein NEPTK9_000520 [Candidatus Neptunochlamydia vexilliferae]|uniref:Uncharacterized protein n=1 Tax=Candidatus Neptunichlamydia vexilliferae TaxID=1651774 RepID=A0ABS0AXZ6_9BACT|nr:hypothetical protein [Candidatus Neptunochlamydia vexilliferae]